MTLVNDSVVGDFHGRLGTDDRFDPTRFDTAPRSRPHEYLDCRLWVRGYLADRDELTRDLGLKPGERTDGELLAHAFRAWGTKLQEHVLGEYAVVVYEPATGDGLLTHDSLGIVPLFYTASPDGVRFSTRITDLVDAAAIRGLDEEFLADFLVRGSSTTERTPYRHIQRLMPGQTLSWRDGRLKKIRSWKLGDGEPLHCRNDAEYEEQLRSLIGAGINSALANHGPTWIALSGGLDSSTVASVAAHAGVPDLAAYSVISPSWPHADEQRWMRAVVDTYDIPWHPVDVERVLPFSRLPDVFVGEPTECVIDWEMMRVQNQLLSSHGAQVMLTGAGGDVVLGASRGEVPIHLADLLVRGKPLQAFRAMSDWRREAKSQRSHTYWLFKSLLEPAANHLMNKRNRGADPHTLPPWIDDSYARDNHLARREEATWTPRSALPSRQVISDSLWAFSAGMDPPTPMSFVQRHPLLYRPLVEFMWKVPWEQKLRPNCDRYLQRRALRGILPELVRRRASAAPGTSALVEGLRRSPEWQDYLCDQPMIVDYGIANKTRWRDAVKQASVGQTHGDKYFITGVAIEVWLKQLAEIRILSALT